MRLSHLRSHSGLGAAGYHLAAVAQVLCCSWGLLRLCERLREGSQTWLQTGAQAALSQSKSVQQEQGPWMTMGGP